MEENKVKENEMGKDSTEEFDKLKKKLEEDSLFNMSLSSKELFHSNFWAWLTRKYKQFRKIFSEDLLDGNVPPNREKNNMDLIFTLTDKKVFVVENKFKSIAKKEQLQKYQEKLGNKFAGGVVTGLIEPSFLKDDDMKGWKFLSYEKISERISDILKEIKEWNEPFDKVIIARYADMISNLHTVLVGSLDLGIDTLECKYLKSIKKIRLHDIYQKLKMEKFLEWLNKDDDYKEMKEKISKNYQFYEGVNYSNGNALVEFKIYKNDLSTKKEKDKAKDAVGIQIQGKEFRVLLELTKDNNNVDTIFNQGLNTCLFVEYNKEKKIKFNFLKEKSLDTSMDVKFRSYKPHFVFQYFNIEKENNSYESLKEYIFSFFNWLLDKNDVDKLLSYKEKQ